MCISISRCHDKFKDLREAVREAQFSFDSRFFIENRHVIHYNSLKSNSMANLYPIMQKVEETGSLSIAIPRENGIQELK